MGMLHGKKGKGRERAEEGEDSIDGLLVGLAWMLGFWATIS